MTLQSMKIAESYSYLSTKGCIVLIGVASPLLDALSLIPHLYIQSIHYNTVKLRLLLMQIWNVRKYVSKGGYRVLGIAGRNLFLTEL